MLEAISLTKSFAGKAAVHALDLRVAPREVFCLLGANGAGKTTTLNLFLGFISPDSGDARVGGISAQQDPLGVRRKLAYVPEQVTLYPRLTGRENLLYFSALAGVELSRAEQESSLTEAGLQSDAVDRRVETYSKGMRQKVGLAIALARRAEALLLDEPTSGLDPLASNELSKTLTRIAQGGMAVLMATHDLFRAKETGTRVGIMKAGKLLETRPTESLGHAERAALPPAHA